MENSIEEITFVENEIKNTRRLFEEVGCYVFFDENLCKAIEHILSDYKRVLKENEELKEENEYNKILLDMNNNFTIDKKTGNYKWNVIEIQKVKDKIEELKQEKGEYGNCLIEMYEDELINRDIKILQELIEKER